MAELCLVGYTYRGYPMAYALERAAAYGYGAVEVRNWSDIDLSTPSGVAAALDRALPLAAERGLRVHSIFGVPVPAGRAGEDETGRQAFAGTLEALGSRGVPVCHTWLRVRRDDGREVVSAAAREEDYRRAAEALAWAAPLAERAGVRIALESHMGTIHDTAASLLRVVQSVDSPAVVASPDPANMLITHRQEDLPAAIRALGPRIGYVHLKNLKLTPTGYDWNLPLRWGDINYHRVLSALRDTGYHGPLAVEYCGTGDPDVFAADDACYLRELAERIGL